MAGVTEYISQGRTFFGEVIAELKKVYWPPRNETVAFTAVVVVVVAFVSAYLGVVDWVLSLLMGLVFRGM
jgi:preprotein translocase subunit SecE